MHVKKIVPFLCLIEGEGGSGSGAGSGQGQGQGGGGAAGTAGTESSATEQEQPGSQGQSGQETPKQADPPKNDDAAGLKTALESERSLRKDAEKKAKDAAKLQARVEELESANQSESEKALAAARKEGAAEATTRANARLVSSEARALAAQAKFRDANVAVRLLDLGDVTVADDGTVDADAISKRLTELAKDNPYLLGDDKPPPPKPDPTQGSRSSKVTGMSAGREMFEAGRKKRAPAS